MKLKVFCFVLYVSACSWLNVGFSQSGLQPGFDAAEYGDLLHLNFVEIGDSNANNIAYVKQKGTYEKVYRSPEVGLHNLFEVLVLNDNTAVINLRGSVGKIASWIENFYSAMVPANGQLKVNDSTFFNYKLANNNAASVHVGWLVGLAHLAPLIDEQLTPLLQRGINDVLIIGHSQGGALAFLTTSYLWYKYQDDYPSLRLKTYASAAPKPGNLYYAYDFDFITRGGFAFRIVNTADWVPESPISVQVSTDFNDVNPFTNGKKLLKSQQFFVRLALGHIYIKMTNASYKTMKNYQKYLGKRLFKQVKKSLPTMVEPNYVSTSNYVPAGVPIVLPADSLYHQKFPFDGKNLFVHHMLKPYQYLLHQYYPTTDTTNTFAQ